MRGTRQLIKSYTGSERGAALFTAVFSVLLLTVLGISLMLISESSRSVSRNNIEAAEAYYIAEAGLAHAVGLLKENGASFDFSTAIPTSGTGLAFGSGNYVVQTVFTAGTAGAPDEIRITSTGTGSNGATATVEAVYTSTPTVAQPGAIVVNGDVSVSANIQVTGTNGIIHSNGTMVLNGNNRAELHFSATGNIVPPAPQPCPNGSVTGPAPTCDAVADLRPMAAAVAVPALRASDFAAQANYFLVPPAPSSMPGPISAVAPPVTATVFDSSGIIIADNCEAGCWGGWTYNPVQGFVINGGSTLPDGVYLAHQASIQVNTTFGSLGTPQRISFLADGHVSFTGGTSYFDAALNVSGEKYAVIANADVVVGGASLVNTGKDNVYYARHQFALQGGSPVIDGRILVYNEADGIVFSANPVVLGAGGAFYATGDPTVRNDGGGGGGGTSAPTLIRWREVRN